VHALTLLIITGRFFFGAAEKFKDTQAEVSKKPRAGALLLSHCEGAKRPKQSRGSGTLARPNRLSPQGHTHPLAEGALGWSTN
jgi:hypothetical protein